MQDFNIFGIRLWNVVLVCMMVVANVSNLSGQTTNESSGASSKPQSAQAADSQSQDLTQQDRDAIQIQMDTKGPIFLYDQSGGFRVVPAGERTADLQLFADGRVLVGGSNFGMPKLESKISETELNEFLHFVVNTNGFYKLDEKEIEKQMKNGNEKVKLMDAATTRFEINLQRGSKGLSVYALWNAVRNYPEIEELRKLSRIEKRCKQMISEIHLGDDGPMVLKLVNQEVAKLDQKLEPFTMDEIQNATRMTTGRFQVRFGRELTVTHDSQAPQKKTISAIYFRSDANSKPTVQFYGLPKK